jgi:hypothetical protein
MGVTAVKQIADILDATDLSTSRRSTVLPLPAIRHKLVDGARLQALRSWADVYTRWAYDPMPSWLRYPSRSDRSGADRA